VAPDGTVWPDASDPADGAVFVDGQPAADAQTPTPDGSQAGVDPDSLVGGCGCRTVGARLAPRGKRRFPAAGNFAARAFGQAPVQLFSQPRAPHGPLVLLLLLAGLGGLIRRFR
jgi:hypothetical protein